MFHISKPIHHYWRFVIMEALSPWHLAVVAVVAVVMFFGWKQLPDMTRSLGRSLRIFKTELKGIDSDAERESRDLTRVVTAAPTTAPTPEPTPAPPTRTPVPAPTDAVQAPTDSRVNAG
jgi:sec-independent protein translocase protein TatA